MKIYTFDSRDLITWNILKDHFKLSTRKIFHEISVQFDLMNERLNKINVPYNELKNVLTPQKDKKEICFIFDSLQIEDTCYGCVVLDKIMPSILEIEKVAVFYGDMIGPQSREGQKKLKKILLKKINGRKDLNYKNSNQLFIVFLNNMTEHRLHKIENAINALRYYIGYLDLTFQTQLKDVISASISQQFLIYKNIVIIPSSEDDDEDVNYSLYNFKKHNYLVKNVDQTAYGSFLCFKICRNYYEFDQDDLLLSLNAVSESPTFIDDFNIKIDDSKFKYLIENKSGSLSITGLDRFSIYDFKNIITTMINRNYIFNIEYKDVYNCLKFNTILDLFDINRNKREKYIISFEYMKENKELRLITMY